MLLKGEASAICVIKGLLTSNGNQHIIINCVYTSNEFFVIPMMDSEKYEYLFDNWSNSIHLLYNLMLSFNLFIAT